MAERLMLMGPKQDIDLSRLLIHDVLHPKKLKSYYALCARTGFQEFGGRKRNGES